MERDDVILRLLSAADRLRGAGISRLYLFGSTARGEASPESDVDLFFDTEDPCFNLIELVRAKDLVEEVLGTEADLMTRDSLHPALRDRIEAQSECVY